MFQILFTTLFTPYRTWCSSAKSWQQWRSSTLLLVWWKQLLFQLLYRYRMFLCLSFSFMGPQLSCQRICTEYWFIIDQFLSFIRWLEGISSSSSFLVVWRKCTTSQLSSLFSICGVPLRFLGNYALPWCLRVPSWQSCKWPLYIKTDYFPRQCPRTVLAMNMSLSF